MTGPRTASPERGIGLYVHVPFCAHRCGYCDFNTYAGLDDLMPSYVQAVRADLERVAAGRDDWPVFTSLFFGGGTPTLLAPDSLAGLVRHARALLPFAGDAEVTVEANPETVTAAYMEELAAAGVNRVSMGMQSAVPRVLDFLERRHDPETPLRAVEAVRAAGVGRISLDLIYGTPGESATDWERTLGAALAARTEHVSAYALTLEPNTAYGTAVRAGNKPPPDDDVAAERMAQTDERLAAAGLHRYEISSWARPGAQARHNLTYWRGGNWLAVGAGAHGAWDARRWWSHRAPQRYVDAALAGEPTTAGSETLTAEALRTERLMMGLRLAEGVARAEVEPVDEDAAVRFVAGGLLSDDGARLRLTETGLPVAGGVIRALAV